MKQFIWFTVLLIFFGCGTSKRVLMDSDIDEIRDLDTLVVTASREVDYEQIENDLPTYNPSYLRLNDLLHTKLELRFDWPNEQVIGTATITATPLSRPQRILQLDAKNFDFHSVKSVDGTEMNHEYVDNVLYINLGKAYQPGEEYQIIIDYTANPTVGSDGGSAAITSDQGLFFINPKGENPFKPQQIWTQGETEWNSRWFPTIDKPNERCTQEVIVTVNDRFETLSNGLKISSTKHDDGTRTDHWKMDMPHAPYLFALVVGDYAVVHDRWKDIDVDYYVEPKFEKDAKAIFPHTAEMLEFFSNKLDLDYPWPKYSQVVVRDYVSGAMENTTAVIFGEFMQDDARALAGNSYSEQIVAHEMFHHWFGDYVTCESWANLTMNEGFANYSEYLWIEHKHGRLDADYHRFTELQGYLQSIQFQGAHPLIHFSYSDKEDMFDAHSYNKGGLILHMLRRYVGDNLFFKALNLYLKDNAFQSVEAHDLRLAFEEITGEDLNWFWNQWYFASGHPKLEISKSLMDKKVLLVVQQTQEGPKVPTIFQLPVKVDILGANGAKHTEEIWIDQRAQTFNIDVDFEPLAVVFDGDDSLLAEIDHTPKAKENETIFYNTETFIHQYLSFGALLQSPEALLAKYTERALKHEGWVLRYLGMNALDGINDHAPYLEQIKDMARADDNLLVRSRALDYIGAKKMNSAEDILIQSAQPQLPFEITTAAIKSLRMINPAKALDECVDLQDIDNSGLLYWCGESFAASGESKYWSYFDRHLGATSGVAAEDFFKTYLNLANEAQLPKALNRLKEIAEHNYDTIDRRAAAYIAYKTKASATERASLKTSIKENTQEETYLLITKGE